MTEKGTVFGFGYNAGYTLGLGDTARRSSPVCIKALTDVSKIYGTFAITNNGTVYAWSWAIDGKLGTGAQTHLVYPEKHDFFSSLHIKKIVPLSNCTFTLTSTLNVLIQFALTLSSGRKSLFLRL